MLRKILTAKQFGKKIHGSCRCPNDLNVYMATRFRTDHESTTASEAKRLSRGMYLMIREGTVAKELQQLIPIVNDLVCMKMFICNG